jgi:hypothetical protein
LARAKLAFAALPQQNPMSRAQIAAALLRRDNRLN